MKKELHPGRTSPNCVAAKLKDPEERDAFTLWAINGTTAKGYDHLLPQSRYAAAPVAPPTVHKETTAPFRP